MSETPLFDAAARYAAADGARFHTPGHSGRADFLRSIDLLRFDLTEIEGLDSLYEAAGPIDAAERLAAELYGVRRTLFSAGGCTLAIQTMLALAARGGEIVAGRNLHRAAVNACALLDITPRWVYPDAQTGVIEPGELERVLNAHPGARAAYVTSPDYYGRLCDIAALSAVCRAHGVPLLVDNAHGAHLKFVPGDLHPAHLGAAMTACSAHKTLPVLTGGAFLHIADARYAQDAKAAMAVFGSTSPSYLTLASLDLARAWLARHGAQAFAQLARQTQELRAFAAENGVRTLSGRVDPVRLTLDLAGSGLSGKEAACALRETGCEPEYADSGYAVLILTPFHTQADFARLRDALRRIGACSREARDTSGGLYRLLCAPRPVRVPLRDALFAPRETVPADRAAGRVAAQAVCPCPPGIPAVIPGEEIDACAVELLNFYGIRQVDVVK